MIISWLDIFQQINLVFPLNQRISDKTLKILISTGILFTAFIFFLFAALRAVIELLIGYAHGGVVLALGFLIGYCKFKIGLDRLLEGNLGSKEKAAVNLVRTAFRVNAICFTGAAFLV